ncbi:hypothetical protein [Roseobacter sp. S98]|uniref:hypothetical protein n=1 Tax=Roseobacter algicola (ex Choi et al. 2025) (nom. illeg.) TaxID=3092138 RepID=UPI0035C72CEE
MERDVNNTLETDRKYARLYPFLQLIVAAVILLLSLISGGMTFEGAYLLNLRVGGQSFATVATAGLLAIGITAGIVTAWWVMMSILPMLRGVAKIVAGLVLIIALQFWMLSVSTTNNAIALGAADALITHMETTSAAYEAAISATLERGLAIKPYIGLLQGEAESRCEQAKGERERGTVTGSKGPGAVTGILELLCTQSTATVRAMRQAVEATEMRADEITRLLSKLDMVIWDHNKTVFKREAAFLSYVGDAKAWLRLASADDLTQTLNTAHGVMAAAVTPPSVSSGAFGATQQKLITGLKRSVEETGEVYKAIAATIAAKPVPVLPEAARISLIKAVWKARLDLWPQLAAAVGIDYFQLFMVLAFMIGRPQSAR